jgi:hypothetical protein
MITGKTSLFEPKPSSKDSARFVLHSTIRFSLAWMFSEQGRQPCVRPPIWSTRSLYLCPPVTGWPIIPPGIGFPFRRLLRLTGLRWRFSDPPPHGVSLTIFIWFIHIPSYKITVCFISVFILLSSSLKHGISVKKHMSVDKTKRGINV